MLTDRQALESAEHPITALDGRPRSVLRRTMRSRGARFGLAMLVIIALVQVAGPYIAPYDPYTINLTPGARYDQGPSLHPFHPLGTDDLGRDILSRLMVGGRIPIVIALIATASSILLGAAVGGIAGLLRGTADAVLMMITNWFLSFPFFLLALAIIAVRGPGLTTMVLAMVASGWPLFARLWRGQVLAVRETEYVEAARAAGAGRLRILLKHVLPNSLAPVIAVTPLAIAANITGEAVLSFLGIGIPPPAVTWGNMSGAGEAYLQINPVEVLAPSIAIGLTVIAIALLGNALRDAVDPKQRD
jgi:peptide/nickel transport system permease protein